tara:strand:- start:6948 stop:7697 length:750 start_codon:yes stop_codon:yes gene_type:complete
MTTPQTTDDLKKIINKPVCDLKRNNIQVLQSETEKILEFMKTNIKHNSVPHTNMNSYLQARTSVTKIFELFTIINGFIDLKKNWATQSSILGSREPMFLNLDNLQMIIENYISLYNTTTVEFKKNFTAIFGENFKKTSSFVQTAGNPGQQVEFCFDFINTIVIIKTLKTLIEKVVSSFNSIKTNSISFQSNQSEQSDKFFKDAFFFIFDILIQKANSDSSGYLTNRLRTFTTRIEPFICRYFNLPVGGP